nr:hypothetical protein [Paludibacterium denitrificans]
MAITQKQKVIGGGLVAAIIAFTSPWEGERHVAYKDPVGIWTICMGETQGVRPACA